MKYLIIFALSFLCLFGSARAQITFRKLDSTLKIGKAGYRVDCRNKTINANQLDVRPVGFESGAQPISFMLRGRVSAAQVDDLNADGYPDLILFTYADSSLKSGMVYVFVSEANKDIAVCVLPDVTMDGKVNVGYRGYDQFSLMEGSILQRFPIYNTGDDKDHPTGGYRVLMYQLGKGEGGGYKLNRTRIYDTK